MAVDYGGMVGPSNLTYGVPTSTWLSWDIQTRDKYLEDYNRTGAQQDYVSNQSNWYNAAYIYTGVIDSVLGKPDMSVETGQWINEDVKPKVGEVLDTGKELAVFGGLLALLFLLGK